MLWNAVMKIKTNIIQNKYIYIYIYTILEQIHKTVYISATVVQDMGIGDKILYFAKNI